MFIAGEFEVSEEKTRGGQQTEAPAADPSPTAE